MAAVRLSESLLFFDIQMLDDTKAVDGLVAE
jgi:hypothetical protein